MNFWFLLTVIGLGNGVWGMLSEGRLFNKVTFKNDPCIGSDGVEGICLSQPDCQKEGGIQIGQCAKGN